MTGPSDPIAGLEAAAGELAAVRFLSGTSYGAGAEAARQEAATLLAAKILPEARRRLAGPVVATVAGGTNVGKTTTFNHLAGRVVAEADETAGATKSPCLYVHRSQVAVVAADDFLPGYRVAPLEDPKALVRASTERRAFYVVHDDDALADLVLVDSPDVDSTIVENARVGLDLLFVADVLVLVTTDQKYLDRRPLEHLATALELDREVLVVLNKMQGDDNFRTIRSDFAASMVERFGIATELPTFGVSHFGRGGPDEFGSAGPFREVRQRLLDGARAGRKERAFRGSVAAFVGRSGRVLETFERESEAIGRQREALDYRVSKARVDFEAFARKMASESFWELQAAIRTVLERYRIPVVDDVFDKLRVAAEGVVGFVKTKVFGRAASEGTDGKIARRKDDAFEATLDLVAAIATGARGDLRRAREESEVAGRVYEALVDVDVIERDALRSVFDERMAPVDGLAIRLEERIVEWLEENPRKSAYLHLFKTLFRVGIGTATAFLTGGIGPEDLLYGPISVPLTEAALGQLAPPGFFRRFRDEFVESHLAVHDAVVRAGWLDAARAAFPGADAEASATAGRLRERLAAIEGNAGRVLAAAPGAATG